MRGIGYVIAAAVFSLGATPAHGGAIRPTTEAATPPAHHLYVAIGCTPNPPHVAVLRYGLASGGTISESPDLVYDGAGAPLSIGTQGEL